MEELFFAPPPWPRDPRSWVDFLQVKRPFLLPKLFLFFLHQSASSTLVSSAACFLALSPSVSVPGPVFLLISVAPSQSLSQKLDPRRRKRAPTYTVVVLSFLHF